MQDPNTLHSTKWLIIGDGGCGKTTVYNKLTGENRLTSPNFASVTNEKDSVETASKIIEKNGVKLTLIDTEGIGASTITNLSKVEKIFEVWFNQIASIGEKIVLGIDGILFCIGAATRINHLDVLYMQTLVKLFGEKVVERTILVVTKIDTMQKTSVDQYISNNRDILIKSFGNVKIFGSALTDITSFDKLLDCLISTAMSKESPLYLLRSKEIEQFVPDDNLRTVIKKKGNTICEYFSYMVRIHIITCRR